MHGGENTQAIDWMWIVFVACVGFGALSTMKWLWDYSKDIVLGMVWNYMAKAMETKTEEIGTYQKGKVVSMGTQIDWYEIVLEQNEREFMQNKLFQPESIERGEESISLGIQNL